MNDLERLKQAEEAEPMGVVVIPRAESCGECYLSFYNDIDEGCFCAGSGGIEISDLSDIEDWCPLQPAIALVEPNGHLIYLGEEVE